MSKPAVIGGWFTNVSFLTKIDVARVTIEIPKDLWEQYQEVLGVPPSLDGAKKYVAISRITEEAFKNWSSPLARPSVPVKPEPVAEPEKAETDRIAPKLRSNLAAVLCKENTDFQAWIGVIGQRRGTDEGAEDADRLLKSTLGIASKRDLDSDPDVADRFDRLTASFRYRQLVRP